MEYVDALSTILLDTCRGESGESVDVRREAPEPWATAMTQARAVNPKTGAPSMGALARRADVSTETVRQAMYGGRDSSPETVRALADALGIDVRTVSEWVGQARAVSAAYHPPQEADLLTDRERKAVDELIRAITATRGDRRAQAPEPQQGTGGPTGGGPGVGGAPIEPSPESMDKLRKLNGEDTNRSRDDPKSG